MFSRLTALFRATGTALREVRNQRHEHEISSKVAQTLESELQATLDELETQRDELRSQSEELERDELVVARMHLLMVQKDALHEASAGGIIDEEVLRDLVGEIDAELSRLADDEH